MKIGSVFVYNVLCVVAVSKYLLSALWSLHMFLNYSLWPTSRVFSKKYLKTA